MVGRFGLPSVVIFIQKKFSKVMAFALFVIFFIPLAAHAIDGRDIFQADLFVERLVDNFGDDGYISVKQLSRLLQESGHNKPHITSNAGDDNSANGEHETDSVAACRSSDDPNSCVTEMCLSANDIFNYHSVNENSSANVSQFKAMTPTVLYQLHNPTCHEESHGTGGRRAKPTTTQVWGFSFLCVTLINLCALTGMVFLPLMKKSFYTRLLMFMVALAVGTLAGSSLLFLIPECFGMTHENSPLRDVYIWKSTAVIAGVYLFFLTERLLKMIMNFKRKRRNETKPSDILSSIHSARHRHESMNMSFEPPAKDVTISEMGTLLSCTTAAREEDKNSASVLHANGKASGHSHTDSHLEIKSVAWMIIFGDGLHNFIDGLSIGAAFAGDIMTGFSVSVAVICEELPHELGDFAILLNSGMSMRQALGYNFLSACMCYLGLIIGILIGEMTSGAEWIFAIAGGMFLYISLVDMLPEVNHAAESSDEDDSQLKVFFIQNCGLLLGYGIMLFLAVFSGEIDFT